MPLTLSADESAVLNGESGDAAAFAMQVLARFAAAVGAPSLLEITRAHIDGCLYHGQVNLDFVERLVAGGGRVRVPTSLNVGAVDLIHPELVQLKPTERTAARRLMEAHEQLGCQPSFTCAPYQTRFRPALGEQIAWGESNAIAFANSVIGARTNRYGDFIDLCCAMTGRAPAWGLHLEENRRAQILFTLAGFPSSLMWTDSLAVGVGLFVGATCGDRIPAIAGLPPLAESAAALEGYLKALGAAAASSGAVALFHAIGLTPEAPTADVAFGGRAPAEIVAVTPADLRSVLQRLSTVPEDSSLSAVCLGTPHFSRAEWDRLLPMLRAARTCDRGVPVYVNTGRDTLADLQREDALPDMESLNLIVVTDTCTYLTPILRRLDGAIMTNSGKWAYYGPGNLGVQVAFGDLEECVASAAAGRIIRRT
jgi:predicted aconitase